MGERSEEGPTRVAIPTETEIEMVRRNRRRTWWKQLLALGALSGAIGFVAGLSLSWFGLAEYFGYPLSYIVGSVFGTYIENRRQTFVVAERIAAVTEAYDSVIWPLLDLLARRHPDVEP